MNILTKSLTGLGLGAMLTLTATTAMASGSGCGTFTNAEGVVEHLSCSKAPIDFTNKGSLQNGAKTFMNYCAGCHSAKYVRHSRIAKDLEIPPELVEKYLMVTTDQIGDHINAEIDPEVQASWFGAAGIPMAMVQCGCLQTRSDPRVAQNRHELQIRPDREGGRR